MSGNFDDIEMTSGKAAALQERMYLVSKHMYKQFSDYRQSNSNTASILDKMAENSAYIIEYFKKSFKAYGIPAHNIYFEYKKQQHILFLNILWQPITFFANMKGFPMALERVNKETPEIMGRIIAVKGAVPELSAGYTAETEQKMLKMEAASLFIPADTSARAIMKITNLLGQEFLISQNEAPRDFLFRVIEMVCGGGSFHNEGSRVTISI